MKIHNCPFCNIQNAERIYYSDKLVTAFLAKDAIAPGQSLVIPNRHVTDFSDLTIKEIETLFFISSCISKTLKKLHECKGINLALNIGRVAGQSVEHIHVHLIPRQEGDINTPKLWLNKKLFEKLYTPTKDEYLTMSKKLKESVQCVVSEHSHNVPYLKGTNIHIGENVTFGSNVSLYTGAIIGDNCIIGDNVSIGYLDKIENYSEIITQIGNKSIIRSGSVIYSGTIVGSHFDCGHNTIVRESTTIGNNCYFLPNTQVHSHVIIGNDVKLYGFVCNRSKISSNCVSMGSLVHQSRSSKRGELEDSPSVERNVIIGIGSVIIGGVCIGENSIIGAGSIVTETISSGSTVAGPKAQQK